MTLYIAYPDIPWRAKTLTVEVGTEDTDYKARHSIFSTREQYFRITADGSGNIDLEYDLGAEGGADITATASYLIIARADKITSATPNVALSSGTDGAAYTARYTSGAPAWVANDLLGPRNEDFLVTFSAATAERYWLLQLSSLGAANVTTASKLYFGNAFQMGVDPDFSWDIEFEESEDYSESGARELYRHNLGRYVFSFEWQAVTDDKAQEFFQYIVRQSHRHHYFLYTTAQHQVLNNFRCVHVRLRESRTENPDGVSDRNNITAVFEEVIG